MQNQLEDIKKRLEHLEIENARLRREKLLSQEKDLSVIDQQRFAESYMCPVISADKGRHDLRRFKSGHVDPAVGIGRADRSDNDGAPTGLSEDIRKCQLPNGFGVQQLARFPSRPEDDNDENIFGEQHSSKGSALDKSLDQLTPRRHILTTGRNIWVGSQHKSLQVSYELLGAALPDAIRGFPVTIFAKYEANVNTAIKGVAIAAERLREQGRYVGVEALFRDNRNELTLRVIDVPELPAIYDKNKTSMGDQGALTVASVTDYKVLGGAIAMRVRDKKPTLLRAIGKRAVWAATRALAVAREYIVDDINVAARNLVFAPRFNSVQLSNRPEPSTVVEISVISSTQQLTLRRATFGEAPRTHHTPLILPESSATLF